MQPRTVKEITEHVGGLLLRGDGETVITSVTTDSRRAKPGQLFVPLRGERFDGHDFIAEALAAGASGTFIARARQSSVADLGQGGKDAAFIAVADPLHALQLLAAATRRGLPRVENRA